MMNAKKLTDDMQMGPPTLRIWNIREIVIIHFKINYLFVTFWGNTSAIMMYGMGMMPIEEINMTNDRLMTGTRLK